MTQRPPIPHVPRLICRGCVVIFLLLAVPWSPVFAQDKETGSTVRALERLDEALQHEEGLAPGTKDALHALIVALRAERSGAAESRPPATTQSPKAAESQPLMGADESRTTKPSVREEARWEGVLQRLTAYGDFRLRAESNVNLVGKPNRHRQRVRFRVGTNYRLTDEILVGARLTTGDPTDPQSPHETFGDVLHSFNVSLDRAFVNYRPGWLEGSWFTAGKFGHPFYRNPVYGELVWDADVQPEGMVLGYDLSEAGTLERFGFTAGQYVLLEQSRANEGTASVFQASGRLRLAEHFRSDFGAGYYIYSDVTPSDSQAILDESDGNMTIDRDGNGEPDDFLSRFAILNPILGFTYDGWKLPLTFSTEYILNTRARTKQDQGWAVGASVGKSRTRGDWRFYYQWQVVQQDAVFSPFAQDDFLFATNHRSHVFGVNNQLTNKIGLHIWSLVSAEDNFSVRGSTATEKNLWRLRMDLNVKF